MRHPSLALLVLAATASSLPAQRSPLSEAETRIVQAVDGESLAALSMLERLVNINSGSMNLAGVVKVKDLLQPQFEALGFRLTWTPMDRIDGRAGDLVGEHPCSLGTGKCGKKILLIGHMDTVFEPSSTFQTYSIIPGTNGKVATGPGAADMKGGLVIMLSTLKAMKSAGVLDRTEITLVLSGDEERFGRPSSISRKHLIDAGKRNDIALEFENTARPGGVDGTDSIRIGRRSSIAWKLEATGRTGHSSLIFGEAMGDGAIYEVTRILNAFRTELREPGLTYNVGLILGGATAQRNDTDTGGSATGKVNVIPPAALANGDIRTLNEEQTVRVKAKMEKIVADHLPRTTAHIEFEDGYPAMGATPASEALLGTLQEVNASLGLPKEEVTDPALGGAGDIAFVAPYLPGLVGVGAAGTGAHAEGETIYLDSLSTQAKRMAILMTRLSLPSR